MTTVAELSTYQSRLAGLPPERFIGSILWYSITGTIDRVTGDRIQVPVRVTRDQLEAWFLEFGLDAQFLPPRILKVDAFRKASGKLEREYTLPDGRLATLYVDEIANTPEYVERHILRKVIDPRQQQDEDKHTTEWMATLKFFRGGKSGGQKRASGDHYKARTRLGLNKQDAGEVEAMLNIIQQRYDDLAANLTEDKIRAVVRNYLGHLNAIAVKPSGAMYFVHSTRQDAIDALQKLVHRIGQGCSMDQIPLVDTDNSRQILTDAFQAEVEDDVRLLLGEIAELNARAAKSGGITPELYGKVHAKYQAVQERSAEYTEKLGLAQGKAASALELALDQVMDLAQRIDVKGRRA